MLNYVVFRIILITLGYHCSEEPLLSLRKDTNEDGYMYSPECIFSGKGKGKVSCTGQLESHLLVNMVVSPKC